MSDPFFHFISGSLVGGIAGTEISDKVGCRVNPMFIFLGAGAASVFVDVAQISRFKQAGYSYSKLILESGEFLEIYNYHGVLFWVVLFITIGAFIYWQSAKANKLRNVARKTGWVFCFFATLTIIVLTHLFMDSVFQCAIWPKYNCGWMGG